MHRVGIIVALALFAISPAPVSAQDYPSRPIHIVVGYPPGVGVDFTARLFADWLQTASHQPAIVENRAGAGGEIAAEYVSHADPDGYTLFYAVGSDLEWTKFLSKKPVVDPLKDLTPIATVISSVDCVAVNAASPFKTFDDLAAFTTKNPGKLTYGTAGTLSYYYLMGQALKQEGVDMLHVPYKGNAPVLTALLGREVDVAPTTFGSIKPHVASGKLSGLSSHGAGALRRRSRNSDDRRNPAKISRAAVVVRLLRPSRRTATGRGETECRNRRCAALSQTRRKGQKPRPQHLSDRHERDTPAHCRNRPGRSIG